MQDYDILLKNLPDMLLDLNLEDNNLNRKKIIHSIGHHRLGQVLDTIFANKTIYELNPPHRYVKQLEAFCYGKQKYRDNYHSKEVDLLLKEISIEPTPRTFNSLLEKRKSAWDYERDCHNLYPLLAIESEEILQKLDKPYDTILFIIKTLDTLVSEGFSEPEFEPKLEYGLAHLGGVISFKDDVVWFTWGGLEFPITLYLNYHLGKMWVYQASRYIKNPSLESPKCTLGEQLVAFREFFERKCRTQKRI